MSKNIELIKSLYKGISKKTEFIEKLSVDIGNKPKSIKNHWFGEFWSIPLEHQETVINKLQNWKNETMAR